MPDSSQIHLFGIRHHGPGSARSVLQALQALQPDVILVEGPPDAAEVLPLIARDEMRPPVALLIYVPETPRRAVFYPFAVFSPEWQAMRFGFQQNIPVRLMDLPQAHQLAVEAVEPEESGEKPEQVSRDPLGYLAAAAGYNDGERWWEHMVEQRRDGADLFAAIAEAMTEMRGYTPAPDDAREALREAYMRQTIRAAQRDGFQRIAVVCGAWHVPALATMPAAKEDAELLKGLAKVKVQATWVPWTHGRLTYYSGYGAGIESPGWYQHLWQSGEAHLTTSASTTTWLTRVAHLMRVEDLDVSTAHIIEGVRLAETLAALRERPLPGLPELNEAVQSVFCFGSETPMAVIAEKLIIGEQLGQVPPDTPAIPLQQDVQREQRWLRLPAEAGEKVLDLDLRNDTDRERSHLLHRLNLLKIPWGREEKVSGKSGTFHEVWKLRWQPEFAVSIVEAGGWGNTVADAATAFVRDSADRAEKLADLSQLLDRVLFAELPDAMAHVMQRLESAAALTSDVAGMMDALTPLTQVLRYGNVRQTDTDMVAHVVDGLVARICIGLPGACAALNDDAAREMLPRIIAVQQAISLQRNEEHVAAWQGVLGRLADQQGLHGLIAGRSCRLLFEAGLLPVDEVARRMGLAITLAVDPQQAGAWVEGFLQGSGLVLLHDNTLWQVLDTWVAGLPEDHFVALLPLLRRTFATFPAGERRQIGARARRELLVEPTAQPAASFNTEQADDALGAFEDLF